MPDVGQNLRERNLTRCLNGFKVIQKSCIHSFAGKIRTIYSSVPKRIEVVN
jgi:hypothetical protein